MEAVGNDYLKGYYDLRVNLDSNEKITNLIGKDIPQMNLGFSMNRPWFGTPIFVMTPNDSIKNSVANGNIPYLFHYNESTNELELIGAMKVRTDGKLEIPMNGVYKDYVIITNQADSGRKLPDGTALNGISTIKYDELLTNDITSTEENKVSPFVWIIVSIGVSALTAGGFIYYKKRKIED